MKILTFSHLAASFLWVVCASTLLFAEEPLSKLDSEHSRRSESSTGLLVLTHGSPSPNWAKTVENFVERLRELDKENARFKAIEGANLEFCQPDAATGIERLEQAGCERIIVVPAFVFPTSHSHFDVPAVLGLYSSPSIRETLAEENARVAQPKVPITVVQTLHEGELLKKFVLDETAALSKNPSEEVLILIAHGDEGHEGLIDPTMRELVTQTCGRLGLNEGNWAYCEVGQSYDRTVSPLIRRYVGEGKRVLIVGLYLITSAEKIARISQQFHQSANSSSIEPEPSIVSEQTAFSPNGIISHPNATEFVLQAAIEVLDSSEAKRPFK
ncbi:MAG: CbiX/SirB N-terminal domain-containing protein [Planctomycetia bacterium]|nr:CbiX/SirB N-terminal domain-containing protein [Planctomycetia bacterium]